MSKGKDSVTFRQEGLLNLTWVSLSRSGVAILLRRGDLAPLGTIRDLSRPEMLRLPDCATPRPGERVVWYNDSLKRSGIYLGYGPRANPIIQPSEGLQVSLASFNELRLEDPFQRQAPVWGALEPAQLVKPRDVEQTKLKELLQRRIPPGPRYIDVIEEIWQRGYEIFLVGGTVRDVVGGSLAHDVDLVTSFPLRHALPLLERMFRGKPSIDDDNGFIRLGGPERDGAPFIDLKSFVYRQPGSSEAVFSGNIARDLKHRDFACNAIYYDPINEVFLDPSGSGLNTAEAKELRVICDPNERSPYHLATIAIRFLKFRTRGFHYSNETAAQIKGLYLPHIDAMRDSTLRTYLKRQLLGKVPKEEQQATLQLFTDALKELDAFDLWTSRIEALIGGLE